MKEKLLNYGFCDFQIKTLLAGKKLKTSHGDYSLNGNVLKLKNDRAEKTIVL